MQLTRNLIVEAAVDILNRYGLADMTMRRVATQLSVAPGALYWHVANKQALIGAIAELILTPVTELSAESEDPGLDARAYCRRLREALLLHRDGAELVASALAQPESSLRTTLEDNLKGLLDESDSSAADTGTGARALVHLLLGACMQEQSRRQFAETMDPQLAASTSEAEAEIDDQVELVLAGLRTTGADRP